ncbi:MAG: alpha-1,4-glucan--maltose-1-phosphate maltosyltransferase [Myxococcales bacterium]|nr:alpha-1,4-glucan--maltose-1-phosphate maltosyltransferase [Myxococcales bacterium]
MPESDRLPPPRAIIESVEPEVDAGRFPIKRVVGESVRVRAKIFTEGHDRLAAVLRVRPAGGDAWREVPMRELGNDRWEADFPVERIGRCEYTLEAWVDSFGSWQERLAKKHAAAQDVRSELLEGAELVRRAARRAPPGESDWLARQSSLLAEDGPEPARIALALSEDLCERASRHPDRTRGTRHPRVLEVQVERERARSGAWYEFFPRSCSSEPGRHGTFRDAEERLAHAASMGFDVVYLPPIHPIGRTHRKGPNNAASAGPGDVGSPWAIGADEGGFKAVHPQLGSLADFDRFVERGRALGLEIALDLAFQCSPDHPYVNKHPEWFYRRPDGTIHYAENPPKKYEDIYPLNFECDTWKELWDELRSVVLFWVDHGITIFRVDNPHTKPFAFWEWLIREVRETHPGVLFLAEAFTRPSLMQYLAKAGFSQSYTYFTWRNTKSELTEYFTELAQPHLRDGMRPNLFANTPDILHEYLQTGRRAAFQIRVTLAATLAGNYGIYGPAFELCDGAARPGTEEYQDSEKYQIRAWDLARPGNIRDYIARLNEIRRENPALTQGGAPRFYRVDNDDLIAYGRTTADGAEAVVVVVNLNPYHTQSGWVEIPVEELGLDGAQPYQMDDLLGGARYLWHGRRNYLALDPEAVPAHVFRVRRRVRTERDFDYFL